MKPLRLGLGNWDELRRSAENSEECGALSKKVWSCSLSERAEKFAKYKREEKRITPSRSACADADADADANARPDRIQAAESMTSPLIRTGSLASLFVRLMLVDLAQYNGACGV